MAIDLTSYPTGWVPIRGLHPAAQSQGSGWAKCNSKVKKKVLVKCKFISERLYKKFVPLRPEAVRRRISKNSQELLSILSIFKFAISSSNRFVSAHPRNDLMLGGTFLSIERRVEHSGSNVTNNNHHWEVIYTDADWETM